MIFNSDCSLSFQLLSVLIPNETESLAHVVLAKLAKLDVQQGVEHFRKIIYYAKCSTVNEPLEIKCLYFLKYIYIPVHLCNTKIHIISNIL